MSKQFYVILSEGVYSDYSPDYYVGPTEITKEELEKKGREVGDNLFDWFEALPERQRKASDITSWSPETTEKYDPATDECVWSYSLGKLWNKRMDEWLTSQGFMPLPEEIPEINVSYSEIPTNYKPR